MSTVLLIILLVLFIVGLVLVGIGGRFSKAGLLLDLVILGLMVFWPVLK